MSFIGRTPLWKYQPPTNNRTKVTDNNNAKASKEDSVAADVAASKAARDNKVKGKTQGKSSVNPSGQKKDLGTPGTVFRYNAPMINQSYFGSNSFQSHVMDGKNIGAPSFTEASQAWTPTVTESVVPYEKYFSGRGVIQMDDEFFKEVALPLSHVPGLNKPDLNKYGFRFHYNPQTISMSWGLINEMDPTFIASGDDKFQAVSRGLLTSTVNFQLLLNRVYDFNYVRRDGVLKFPNPYPSFVPKKDVIEIWNRGTMHDIEYFLRTINGPNANFPSDLNFLKDKVPLSTADRGWLKPSIVQLHLGNSLRYKVRIENFSINHVIFNDRMVPMLTTVNLECRRLADGLVYGTTASREFFEAEAKRDAAYAARGGTKPR